MKYAVVFTCTAALVSALRLPLPRAADKNNQVDKQPAQELPGDEKKSCGEQGGTTYIFCSEDEQEILYHAFSGFMSCCLPKATPAEDQKASPESASAQERPGDKKKSCEEQGGTISITCSEDEQSIRNNNINSNVLCCVPKATPTEDQKASPESASAQGPVGDKKSCKEQGRD